MIGNYEKQQGVMKPLGTLCGFIPHPTEGIRFNFAHRCMIRWSESDISKGFGSTERSHRRGAAVVPERYLSPSRMMSWM